MPTTFLIIITATSFTLLLKYNNTAIVSGNKIMGQRSLDSISFKRKTNKNLVSTYRVGALVRLETQEER